MISQIHLIQSLALYSHDSWKHLKKIRAPSRYSSTFSPSSKVSILVVPLNSPFSPATHCMTYELISSHLIMQLYKSDKQISL